MYYTHSFLCRRQVAGNYAADMLPNMLAKKAGYPIGLYLDAKTNTLVEVGLTLQGILRNLRNFVFGCCLIAKVVHPLSPLYVYH